MANYSSFQLLIVLGVVAFCAGEAMVSGTYERDVKPDNKEYMEVLLALGNPKEKAEKMFASKVVMTITEHYDKSYSINTVCPARNHTITVSSGKEYQDTTSDGRPIKGMYTLEGNKVHGAINVGGIDVKTEIEISKEGMKIQKTVNDKTASYNWKRTSPVK